MPSFGSIKLSPPPFGDAFVDKDLRLTSDAFNWFLITLLPAVEQTPNVFGVSPPVEIENQNASIAATSIPLGSVPTGLYRVSIYTRITSPDGVSSSVTPFINFPDEGVSCTLTGTAMTSDAINLPQSQDFLIAVDSPGPIQYGVTYASNTPGAAIFKMTVTVERVQ